MAMQEQRQPPRAAATAGCDWDAASFRHKKNEKTIVNGLLEQCEEYIDQMESSAKNHYFIARETVPELVATETDPRTFLAVEKGDMARASKRLANYWLNRNYFFGDRWLLPMLQTGTGCLTREDIEVLRSGYITVVTLADERQLLVTDATRLKGRIGFCVRERISYYLVTTGLNRRSRHEGVDNAILVSPNGLGNDERFPEMMKRLHTSLPMIAKSIITIPIPEEGKETLVEYFSYLVTKSNEYYDTLAGTLAGSLIAATRERSLQQLEARGIKRIYLPEKVGGSSYFDGQMPQWIRMRLSIEDAMSSAVPLVNLLPSKPDRTDKGLTKIIKRSAGVKFDEKAKESFMRKRNAMYARRRIQNSKLQVVALQDHIDLSRKRNERLREENKRLETLMAKAGLLLSYLGNQNLSPSQQSNNGFYVYGLGPSTVQSLASVPGPWASQMVMTNANNFAPMKTFKGRRWENG